jgi:hypothetical protein
MAGAEQAAGGLYLLAQLTAVVLFIVRVVPTAVRRSWTDADPARHFAVASLWLVAALGMFMLLVFSIISNPEADTLDVGLLLASDHSVYIGVVTNIMLGVLALTVLRRDVPAWAAHLVFWGVNGGLLVFATGLVTEAAELKRIGAPVMGICLLIGLAFIGMRLMERPPADDAMRATD